MTTGPAGRSRARDGKPTYACTSCGWTTTKWVGRCGECQEWGSVVESAPAVGITKARRGATSPQPIAEVAPDAAATRPTGVEEFDRVLGGGLVGGAVVLLAGEPGVGKSTLLLDVASRAAQQGRTVLYVTGEESAGQVRLRAERIGALRPRLLIAAETDLGTVLGHVEQTEPDLLVVDSVQTVASDAVDGTAGNVTQVRAVKNRYGPTDEVGCFDLSEAGITGLADPSGLFLSRHAQPVPGTCVTVTLEGRRPLVSEVQALVAPSAGANPRRATSGLDGSRVSMVLAVLERRAGVRLLGADTYVSSVGGARLVEPACDLAIALAVASAVTDQALAAGTIALGEVGLAGEVRRVAGVSRRLAEAARLGFTRAVVPRHSDDAVPAPEGMLVHEVEDIHMALLRSAIPVA